MKGFAMKKIGEIGWVEKDIPVLGAKDALVRPTAISPCTSDVHTVWSGAIGERTDMILGHEAVGIVEKVGSEVKDFKPGDRVVVPAITPDWNSLEAQAGYSMHSGGMLAGWKFSNFKDGVFAEYFHVNDADGNMAILPESIDDVSGVMLCDMIPTGFHGVELADVQFGDKVLVIGIGPVGLMSVAGAAIRGASEIYAVGSRPNCIEIAKEFGATHIINYRNGSIEEQVMNLTSGKGVEKCQLYRRGRLYQDPACRMGMRYGTQTDRSRTDAGRKTSHGKTDLPDRDKTDLSVTPCHTSIPRF